MINNEKWILLINRENSLKNIVYQMKSKYRVW